MTDPGRKKILNAIAGLKGETDVSRIYTVMRQNSWFVNNYYDYLTTEPMDPDVELKRLPEADWDMCLVFLTLLSREDHFSNGAFENRIRRGDVKAILDRMEELIK